MAIGGSLLVFAGNPREVVNGTGRYQRAGGRVLAVRMVAGGAVTARGAHALSPSAPLRAIAVPAP